MSSKLQIWLRTTMTEIIRHPTTSGVGVVRAELAELVKALAQQKRKITIEEEKQIVVVVAEVILITIPPCSNRKQYPVRIPDKLVQPRIVVRGL